jgi:hypothetical protein
MDWTRFDNIVFIKQFLFYYITLKIYIIRKGTL